MAQRDARRRFLKTSTASISAAGLIGVSAVSRSRVFGANEKLRVASIGTGGKGWSDLTSIAASPHVQVVALCDVDESKNYLGRACETYPTAKTFTDYRRLLDQSAEFDAVIVSTPDHMHAPISIPAMQLGKHVHCQKPLTHTIFETRQMQKVAKEFQVVTQMGNQIQSHKAYRTAVHLVKSGAIGLVREVHSWQSGKIQWFLNDDRPEGSQSVPPSLHWDNWIGVAPERPYWPKIYHSFNWRAWQDFSNGQLGDFGCHILDPVFMALDLKAPVSIRAEAPAINREVWTKSARVQYRFPKTSMTANDELSVTWYDGEGNRPPRTALGLPDNYDLPIAGSILMGEKGSLVIPHVADPKLFPVESFADFSMPDIEARNHYVSWVDACRGQDKTTSAFDYSGPLTETVLLGSIAIRNPSTTLSWNAEKMELSGSHLAQAMLTKPYRKAWEPKW